MLKERSSPASRDDLFIAHGSENRRGDAGPLVGAWEWNVQTGKVWFSTRIHDIVTPTPGRRRGDHRLFDSLTAGIHPADRDRACNALADAVEAGSAVDLTYRIALPDGKFRWVECRADALDDDDGRTVRYIGTLTDVTLRVQEHEAIVSRECQFDTDRHTMEDERAAHILEVDALNARLMRAMAETHHRVKNNLQIIAAMIDMTTSQADDTVPVTNVRTLGTHVRALALIHNMLTKAARNGGEADLVSSSEVLSNLIPLLEVSATGHEIRMDVADVQLPIKVATGLALITTELVQNAVKYGRHNIQVSFSVDMDRAHLCVIDDGPGFPPNFNPETSDETTGIELVRSLSRWDLNGRADFSNQETGGAQVDIEMPLRAVVAA